MMSQHNRAPKLTANADLPFQSKGRGLAKKVLRNSFSGTPLWHKGRALGHKAWCEARRLAGDVRKLRRSVKSFASSTATWLKATFVLGEFMSGTNSLGGSATAWRDESRAIALSVYLARLRVELWRRTPGVVSQGVRFLSGNICAFCGQHAKGFSCSRYRFNVMTTIRVAMEDILVDAESNGIDQALYASMLSLLLSRTKVVWSVDVSRAAVLRVVRNLSMRLVPAVKGLVMGSEIAGVVFKVVTGRKNSIAALADTLLENWLCRIYGTGSVDILVAAIVSALFDAYPSQGGVVELGARLRYGDEPRDVEWNEGHRSLLQCIPRLLSVLLLDVPRHYIDGFHFLVLLNHSGVIRGGRIPSFSSFCDQAERELVSQFSPFMTYRSYMSVPFLRFLLAPASARSALTAFGAKPEAVVPQAPVPQVAASTQPLCMFCKRGMVPVRWNGVCPKCKPA